MIQNKDRFETLQQNPDEAPYRAQIPEKRRKTLLPGEKVDIAGSLVFNAEEERKFRKAHT